MALLYARPTGDQEVVGRPPLGRRHSLVEIDHDSRRAVVSFQRKYVPNTG